MTQRTEELGNIAEFINGVAFKPEDWGSDGPRIIRIQNLTNPKATFNRSTRVVSDKYVVQKGDLLVSWSATLGVFQWQFQEPGLLNQHIFRVVPNEQKVLPTYLNWVLKKALSQMSSHLHGATMQHVNRGAFLSTRVLLPELVEQRRIAAILDQADALRTKRRQALAKLDTLTQSLFLEMFGDPKANPKGLDIVPLGSIATFVGGGTPSRAVTEYFSGNICWATSKDMKGEELLDTQEHITEDAIRESATRLVSPNSILVVVKSKILVNRLPVLISRVPTCFGQDLKAILPKPGWPASFIASSLRIGQDWLLKRARGINTEGLTLEHLREFPILKARKDSLAQFDLAVNNIGRKRLPLSEAVSRAYALFASLQHRAFRGEL